MDYEKPTDSHMSPYDEQDELDRLADQVGSYDEARRLRGIPSAATGLPHQKSWEEIEADTYDAEAKPAKKKMTQAQRRRAGRAAVGPQYGEEAGVGYPDDKPPEHQDFPPISDEQRAINAKGMQKVRDALAEARMSRETEE